MDTRTLPEPFVGAVAALAQMLHARLRHRLWPLIVGVVFASGRRTVTSWLRAAGITDGFQLCYYCLGSVGRKTHSLGVAVLLKLLRALPLGERIVLAIDDSPTKRYGPCVEGAGYHHNPTPGPTEQKYLFGHIWVTLALLVKHPRWHTLALPVLGLLYVRACDVSRIVPWYEWTFRTKLDLAGDLLTWVSPWVSRLGKPVWVVVDGFYNKRPFLKTARGLGVTVVGRLRKDAALRTVPKPSTGRGRPRTYGRERIDLAKRGAHRHGWQRVTVWQYGMARVKMVKTFLATWGPAGGIIRVVMVRESHGWFAFCCTAADASVSAILEVAADRWAIEQTFHDVKEVHGAGDQQVRNLYANIGAWNLVLWVYSLIEWWSWDQSDEQLCDRSDSPWDTEERRPSHADKRKALQRSGLQAELLNGGDVSRIPAKIREIIYRLVKWLV